MKIGVIGTGVAGSLFAAAVRQADAKAEIQAFDRIAPGERDEAGTGLNIGPNAIKALRRKGGLFVDALREASLPWRRWMIALTDGTMLMDLDMLDVADEPGIRIKWADLYTVLRAGSAPLTTHGHGLEALEEDAAGRLVPVFRNLDGALVRPGAFDMLVAGDGRYSRLREIVAGKPQSSFPGIGTWRILVRNVSQSPIDEYGQYFWGNARLLSFRVPDNCIYIAGSFPLGASGMLEESHKTATAQRSFYEPARGRMSAEVAWMLDMVDQNIADANWARTQEIDTVHQGMGGRVLLLGDAAHAMFQTLGQGATQAIEDALVAASVAGSRPATPAAFANAYESQRADRVEFAKIFTRDATDTLMPGNDPIAGSRAKGQEPFLGKLRTLYRNVA